MLSAATSTCLDATCELVHTCNIAYGIHAVYIGLHFVVDNDTRRIEIDTDQIQFIFHYIRFSTDTTE